MLSDRTSKRLEGIAKCSTNGVRVKRLFHLMTNYPDLWMEAYVKIYGNQGAITAGVDNHDTLDGFSEQRIKGIMEELQNDTYYPKPAKRVYIPKKDGRKRPLGIPSGNDKIVQSVIKIILEQIYEPVFNDRSHGFRPNKSCHTALEQIKKTWTNTKWIIEVDIKGYFDNIDHGKLVEILEKKIDDRKFINLIKRFLRAGYLEDWKYHGTYSGTPQGGIFSPILANVYLHEFDLWAESKVNMFNRGKCRKFYQEAHNLSGMKTRRRKKLRELKAKGEDYTSLLREIKELEEKVQKLPSKDPKDPNYRRLTYCRYADDFILGVIGSKEEAENILGELRDFIQSELKLELAENKTGIKHNSGNTSFLGYELKTYSSDRVKKIRRNGHTEMKRTFNGAITLSVPVDKIRVFVKKNGIGIYDIGKTFHKLAITNRSDAEILCTYNAELRGFANYYCLARNVKHALGKLQWMYHDSLAKTLGRKHKTSKSAIYRKYRDGIGNTKTLAVKINTKNGERIFKAFKLKNLNPRSTGLITIDNRPNTWVYTSTRTKLEKRLRADRCELCGKEGKMEVHQVRKLKDVNGKALWQRRMAAMRRKTLVVCKECHRQKIHQGKSPANVENRSNN